MVAMGVAELAVATAVVAEKAVAAQEVAERVAAAQVVVGSAGSRAAPEAAAACQQEQWVAHWEAGKGEAGWVGSRNQAGCWSLLRRGSYVHRWRSTRRRIGPPS